MPTAINRGSTIFLITANGKFIEIFELTILINFKKKKKLHVNLLLKQSKI